MAISIKIVEAVRFLESLKTGDKVLVTDNTCGVFGTTHEMTVYRPAHRSDGFYGSIESTRATVRIRPGDYSSYSRELKADEMASGHIKVVKS